MPVRVKHSTFDHRTLVVALTAVIALLVACLSSMPARALDETGTGGMFTATSGRVLNAVAVRANTWTSIPIAGQAGVPALGAGSVVVNATVSRMTGLGQLFGRPDSSTSSTLMMTYNGGDLGTTSDSSTIAIGDDGTIQVETNTAATLYVDVEGYYSANDNGTAPGGFVPVSGTRIVDTRHGIGATTAPIKPGGSLTFRAGGNGGIPTNASGIVANFLAVNETADGYTTPYQTGTAKPALSLHYSANAPTSDTVQVALNSTGQVTIYNSGGTTDLVVDVEGYFTATAGTGAVFTPATGGIYDTRHTGNTAIAANNVRAIPVAGINGIPTMASGLTAVAITLTAIHAANSTGNASVWADGTTKPGTTAVNFTADSIRGNTVIVPIGTNGKIDLGNYGNDSTDFQIELQGWYINPVAPTISCPSAYKPHTWTNSLPSSAITCTISMPFTGDDDGTLSVVVNGTDGTDATLNGSSATTSTVQIPAQAGWYDIYAGVQYSAGTSGSSDYQFGLNATAPSALLATVEAANPQEFENVATDATTSAAVAASASATDEIDGTATVNTSAADGVQIVSNEQTSTDPDSGKTTDIPASTIAVQLPEASTAGAPTVETTGVVSWANTDNFHSVAVVKQDTSVQMDTVLDNASAPTRYSYPLGIPAGDTAAAQPDGSILVTDSDGDAIGGISPAWARDADGTDVPTHYELDGSTVTQVIDTAAATAYPVVADPWLGKALIAKTQWSYAYKNDPRLLVFPTTWGRVWSGTPYWNSQWKEVISKTTSYRSRANTNDMKYQFECHLFWAASYWKASYNLDTTLHRGSLNAYVYRYPPCN